MSKRVQTIFSYLMSESDMNLGRGGGHDVIRYHFHFLLLLFFFFFFFFFNSHLTPHSPTGMAVLYTRTID